MPSYHVTADCTLHFECVVEAATEDEATALARKFVDFEMESLLSIPKALNSSRFNIKAVDIEKMQEDTAETLELLDEDDE